MTAAPQTPPLHFATIDEAIDAMRERGMRLSTARRLLLEALFAADGAVSAQQLSREVGVDVTSVYRNLELLEQFGAVRHVHLGHGPGLYVLAARTDSEYLYCEQCERVVEVPAADLDRVREEIRSATGFNARFTHFAIVGTCAGCAARARPPSRRPASHRHGHAAHVKS